MYAYTHILISEGWNVALGNDGLSAIQPPNMPDYSRADSLSFQGRVKWFTTSPTTGKLWARLMLVQPHVEGYQNSTPLLHPAPSSVWGDSWEFTGGTLEADGRILLAERNVTPTGRAFTIATRRPFTGHGAALEFSWEFTGGNNPAALTSLVLVEKGR